MCDDAQDGSPICPPGARVIVDLSPGLLATVALTWLALVAVAVTLLIRVSITRACADQRRIGQNFFSVFKRELAEGLGAFVFAPSPGHPCRRKVGRPHQVSPIEKPVVDLHDLAERVRDLPGSFDSPISPLSRWIKEGHIKHVDQSARIENMKLNSKAATFVVVGVILAALLWGFISDRVFETGPALISWVAGLVVLGSIGRLIVNRLERRELAKLQRENERTGASSTESQ